MVSSRRNDPKGSVLDERFGARIVTLRTRPVTGEHLLLLVAITSAMSVVTALRRKVASWAIVNGVFLAAATVGYVLDADRAGVWLVAPYVLFVVVPIVALVQLQRLLAARRYRAAKHAARIASVLHPFGQYRAWIQMTEVWQLAADGKLDEAEALLRESRVGREDALLEILRLRNRWDDLLAHIDGITKTPIDHGTGVLYLRALGETGQLDRMVDLYREAMARWQKRDDMAEEIQLTRLFVAAFLGQPVLVEGLCNGPLRHYSTAIQLYWLATAHAAAGDLERANAVWNELRQDPEWRTRTAAEYRAAHAPARAGTPSAAAAEIIDQIAHDLSDAATYAPPRQAHRPLVCHVLVAAILAMHGVAWWRTQDDPLAIYDLGLFFSTAVLDEGEWWRIVAAMFLHAGILHIAMNVLGILWFGPFVERFLGRARMLVLFLAGGAGGFAVLAALDALGLREPSAALGASGGVMALIGASIAIFLRGRSRSPIAASRLREMIGFVGVQIVFDALAPQISMTGHLSGLVIGFSIGLFARPR